MCIPPPTPPKGAFLPLPTSPTSAPTVTTPAGSNTTCSPRVAGLHIIMRQVLSSPVGKAAVEARLSHIQPPQRGSRNKIPRKRFSRASSDVQRGSRRRRPLPPVMRLGEGASFFFFFILFFFFPSLPTTTTVSTSLGGIYDMELRRVQHLDAGLSAKSSDGDGEREGEGREKQRRRWWRGGGSVGEWEVGGVHEERTHLFSLEIVPRQ